MDGLHLTSDLHGCDPDAALMCNTDALRRLCLGAVHAAGLQPVGELFHHFAPAAAAQDAVPAQPTGITGVVLLAESHLAVHTWPERAAVTIDVYVCNFGADNSARAHQLLEALVRAFGPTAVQRHVLQRGGPCVAPSAP